jgi:hypothetical protein
VVLAGAQADIAGEDRASAAGAIEPDPWGLNPEPAPPVAKLAKAPKPKVSKATPPDPGHQRCVDAYHDAFLARSGVKPIIGSREAGAVRKLRAAFKSQHRTDEDLIAWLRAFYRDDWRAETTSIINLANDPTRYLKTQTRGFNRPEIGASLQRGDDNMPTRYMTDEDFKR